jgi:hypothetical protein
MNTLYLIERVARSAMTSKRKGLNYTGEQWGADQREAAERRVATCNRFQMPGISYELLAWDDATELPADIFIPKYSREAAMDCDL